MILITIVAVSLLIDSTFISFVGIIYVYSKLSHGTSILNRTRIHLEIHFSTSSLMIQQILFKKSTREFTSLMDTLYLLVSHHYIVTYRCSSLIQV